MLQNKLQVASGFYSIKDSALSCIRKHYRQEAICAPLWVTYCFATTKIQNFVSQGDNRIIGFYKNSAASGAQIL